jgi:hypothetical protein
MGGQTPQRPREVRTSASLAKSLRAHSRALNLESLGSRIVLSAGGLAAGAYELQAPALYGVVEHSAALGRIARDLDSSAAVFAFGPSVFSTLPSVATSNVDVITVRANAPAGADVLHFGEGGMSSLAIQTRSLTAVPYDINLVAPNAGLTLVFNVAAFPSAFQFASTDAFSSREFEPQLRDHSLGNPLEFHRPGAPYQQSPFEPIFDRPSAVPAGTPSTDEHLKGIVHDMPSRGVNAEAHGSGAWVLTTASTSVSLTATSESAPSSKIALAPNRVESTRSDVEGGLIELESSTLPRSKRGSKSGESLVDDESDSDELRRLLDQVWAGWDRAWDAFGELRRAANDLQSNQASRDMVAAAVSDAAAQAAVAGAEGGMIELSAPGVSPTGTATIETNQLQLARSPLDHGQKVRMDAGVAFYQSFELATAPDAAPPARNARATSEKGDGTGSASEKNAKSKAPSVETNTSSAAIVNAGLLLSVPFSVFRLQRGKESEAVRPQLK